ncbi:hypothetical protein QM306_39785, partial [Burkholderia cenocepacia]|nr:hypothetical protein [Burkholderia cenocepacia]
MLKLLLGAVALWLVWYVWRSFRVAARMVREVDADQAAGARRVRLEHEAHALAIRMALAARRERAQELADVVGIAAHRMTILLALDLVDA